MPRAGWWALLVIGIAGAIVFYPIDDTADGPGFGAAGAHA